MTARRRTTWAIIGLVGLAAVAGGFLATKKGGRPAPAEAAPAAGYGPDSPLASLAEGLRRSDATALSALMKRLEAKPGAAVAPLGEADGEGWAAVVGGLRAGFLRFATPARGTAAASVAPIFARFAPEPAPEGWLKMLLPSFDLFNTAMADPEPLVRAAAIDGVGKLWAWAPGRSLTPAEEHQLNEWKDKLREPILRKLADRDPRVRVATVACLGLAPIDAVAAPAVAYLDDPQSGAVRHQVLVSFAARPALMTEDMILKRLHDPELGVPQLAEIVLQSRGLSKDQVALGRLISSPRAEMRASVIPLLKDREDLDPVVWLLRLSHDDDETVRAKAAEAMAGKDSPDLRARLREMADGDASPTVRAAAGKLAARLGVPETTAALPPLPGSPSLVPKAN